MPIRTYIFNRITNKKCRLNGIDPSTREPNKEKLSQSFSDHVLFSSAQLPPKVDLRSEMTPVEDQSRIGSCTANSLAGAYEYLLKKTNGTNIDVSRLFIYYNGRAKKNNSAKLTDSGCSMTDAIEALEESGTCLESIWPYDIAQVNTRPNDQAYDQATNHQITEALKVSIDLDEMKSCLAQGFPFAFGLRLYKSFDKAAKNGIVPMPDATEKGRTEHGRHAMLAVGYSDQSKAFIVRNSWGEKWGEKGYCYIPYDYLTNSAFCFDAWAVREMEQDDLGHENWDEDDSTNYQQTDDNDDDDDDDNHEIQEIEEDDEDECDGNTCPADSDDEN